MSTKDDKNNAQDESSIKEFIVEAEEIIETLNNELISLEEKGSTDPSILNSIFRSAHTLKGLSGMFGYEPMVHVSHHMEELLDMLRLGKTELNSNVVDVLLESMAVISMLLEAKSEGGGDDIDTTDIAAKLEVIIKGGSGGAGDDSITDGIDPDILSVLTEYEEFRLTTNIKEGKNLLNAQATFEIISFDQGLEEVSEQLKSKGEIITTLPSPGSTPGETITFDMVTATELDCEALEEFLNNDSVKVFLVKEGSKKKAAKKQTAPSASPKDQAASDSVIEENLKSISKTVRVDITALDKLMDIAGELGILKSDFAGSVESLRSKDFDLYKDYQKINKGLERYISELQQEILEARLVPLSQIFDKTARVVRKVSRDLGKEVSLVVSGAETKLDKLIIEDLAGPIMHIVRNSVDHGVEMPEDRERAGKPKKGTVSINAFQRGNHVVIEIEDDGKGMDKDAILRKAIDKELITEIAGVALSEEQILNFMFMPGFSTSETVSEISGRGVGMDVVKQNISDMSGMVEISTVKGEGSKVTLVLPMTLAIIQALIVESGGRNFAIPLNSILENFLLVDSKIETIENKEFVHLRDSTIPIIRLDTFLGIPTFMSGQHYVVVVGLAEKRLGLVVDGLKGQQDIVMKSIGKRLKSLKVIAGATDYKQETILVLDVGGIVEECMSTSHEDSLVGGTL